MADIEHIPLPNVPDKGTQLPPLQPQTAPLTGPVIAPSGTGRKRGRKEPPPPPPPPPPPVSEEEVRKLAAALGMSFKFVFAMVAAKRGKHWLLDAEDQETLGALWAPPMAQLLQRYGQYLMWAVAVIGTASVVQPRLERDAELASEAKEKEQDTPEEAT